MEDFPDTARDAMQAHRDQNLHGRHAPSTCTEYGLISPTTAEYQSDDRRDISLEGKL
jgi:hypothetical protein